MNIDGTARLAVVVVNYGSANLLEQNLVPLGLAVPTACIVVVDNLTNSDERERAAALAERHNWLAVFPDSNTGFGVGMNLGIERARAAGATTFLMLNPDATITAESLARLLEASAEHPLALIAPRVLRPDGSVWFAGSDLYLDDGRIRSASRRPNAATRIEPWLSGACLLVTDELWSRVGGFSDDYFLYWEDVDLSHRVVKAGGTLLVCDGAVVVHAEGGTQGEGHAESGRAKSNTYYYFNIRNRLVFAALNLSNDDIRRWRRRSVPIAYEVLLQGGRRQFLRSPRPVWAALRGVRDGLSISGRVLRGDGRSAINKP